MFNSLVVDVEDEGVDEADVEDFSEEDVDSIESSEVEFDVAVLVLVEVVEVDVVVETIFETKLQNRILK